MAAKAGKERQKLVIFATSRCEQRVKDGRQRAYPRGFVFRAPPSSAHLLPNLSDKDLVFPGISPSALWKHGQSLRRTKTFVET